MKVYFTVTRTTPAASNCPVTLLRGKTARSYVPGANPSTTSPYDESAKRWPKYAATSGLPATGRAAPTKIGGVPDPGFGYAHT
jgi:hypothetical protein